MGLLYLYWVDILPVYRLKVYTTCLRLPYCLLTFPCMKRSYYADPSVCGIEYSDKQKVHQCEFLAVHQILCVGRD